MIKYLRNHLVLADGAAFKRLSLIPESTLLIGQRIVLHNWRGLLKIRLLYRRRKLARGVTYVLAHNSYLGYYHWLLESIPKLLEARRTLPQFTLLLPTACKDDFYGDILRLLNITEVAYLEPHVVYQVPMLALAYSEVTMGSYAIENLCALREVIFGALQLVPDERRRRLYVSRKLATRRKVLNEAEVEQALITKGFEVVCFENYSFEQQLRLCASAEIIVGIHGAGLANMVFQPSHARVIELRKFDNGLNVFFSHLAQTLGLSYHLLYCQTPDESQLVQDADIWVDTQQLLALLA